MSFSDVIGAKIHAGKMRCHTFSPRPKDYPQPSKKGRPEPPLSNFFRDNTDASAFEKRVLTIFGPVEVQPMACADLVLDLMGHFGMVAQE